ncbi:MAG TPA: NAD(+) synthase [Thermodesulfobacteriota bacterium]
MRPGDPFFNLYSHDFVRVAVATPEVRVADPAFNGRETARLLERAAAERAVLAVFPELGLSAYTCEDLFHQRALLDACERALDALLDVSRGLPVTGIVGMPVAVDGRLYNCGVVLHRGEILGVVPKVYLPTYREFYEGRHFAPGDQATRQAIDLAGRRNVPFGPDLLFRAEGQPLLTLHVEICEDLWVPIPPSSYAALAGATVLVNLSASNVTVGKAEYRRQLVGNQSARCLAAYLYSAAGPGESTTDLAWDGHALVCENGRLVAESRRFDRGGQLLLADVDLERLVQERMRQTTFAQAAARSLDRVRAFRTVALPFERPRDARLALLRPHDRFPYVPSDPATRDERCREVYEIQAQGLATRLEASGVGRVVIGVSGGLDSTQALLVCARAMDRLGRPRRDILAYTMPGFATSPRTLDQARRLMQAIGCRAEEIDIRPSAERMLRDIGHPFAEGRAVYDTTFENVQAGERTSHLFRLANLHGGLVVGTSDLSELALGFCTYGVGDHMAHYHVNASVPKTLVQYLVRWVAASGQLGAEASAVLAEIAATEFSPELVPGEADGAGPAQRTEELIGPYELHDFSLYYILRYGYAPPKVAFMAYQAWGDAARGAWPDVPPERRRAYRLGEIKRTLAVFLRRFFETSQFKRSCIPDAPKVGSGGSLSPRGDYRAPSDGRAAPWLAELDLIPDDDQHLSA